MTDIRLAHGHGPNLWLLVSALALVALVVWASAFMLGDATAPDELPRVGAAADFGAMRPTVPPVEPVRFESLTPIQTRDRGRMVHLVGVAESPIVMNSVWVRTADEYRVLVRFEPPPPPEVLSSVRGGATVSLTGYVQNIALAELQQVLDSLGVQLPRPPPARKFGDLPDPGFARIDSLYIKEYYISVRPEGIPSAGSEQSRS